MADPKENSPSNRLERVYGQCLAQMSLSESQQEKILDWCLDVAKQRAQAIVNDQRRKSYGKAAVLIAACAEVLRLRGNEKKAESLLSNIRNRFPRHRAFLSELDAAVRKK